MRRKQRKKKGAKKAKWKLLLGSFLIVTVLGVSALIFGLSYLTRDYLVERIESEYNCRFEISEVNVSLFSSPSTIELVGIKLAERDSFAEDAVPHDERPKLETSLIELDRITAQVSLSDILSRKLHIESLELVGVRAHGILYKNGTNNLERLFVKLEKDDLDAVESGTFNAKSSSDFVTHLRRISLEDVDLNMVVESTGLKLKVHDLDLHLNEDIKIDVSDLENTGHTNFSTSAKLDIYSADESVHFGLIEVKGDLSGKWFNATTADYDPDLQLDLRLSENSHLRKVPVIERAVDEVVGADALKWIQKYLGDARKQTYFWEDDQRIQCSFHQNRVTFTEPAQISVGNWDLVASKGSWVDVSKDTHDFRMTLLASQSLSSKAKTLLSFLSEQEVAGLYQGDRLALKAKSSGSFSEPKVKLLNDLSLLKKRGSDSLDKAKDKLKDKLFDMLK